MVKRLSTMRETWVPSLGGEDSLEKEMAPPDRDRRGDSPAWSGRAPHPWDSPGKNTGVGCHSLLCQIFLTQGWNPGLLHYRQILYRLRFMRELGPRDTNHWILMATRNWKMQEMDVLLEQGSPTSRIYQEILRVKLIRC